MYLRASVCLRMCHGCVCIRVYHGCVCMHVWIYYVHVPEYKGTCESLSVMYMRKVIKNWIKLVPCPDSRWEKDGWVLEIPLSDPAPTYPLGNQLVIPLVAQLEGTMLS